MNRILHKAKFIYMGTVCTSTFTFGFTGAYCLYDKRQEPIDNFLDTFFGFIGGSAFGCLVGLACPITVPLAAIIYIDNKNKEKRHTKIIRTDD